jgi:hypothetical protein
MPRQKRSPWDKADNHKVAVLAHIIFLCTGDGNQCSPQAVQKARPGGARPNAQCSIDCSQIGIDRSPRAPGHVLSSSSILSIRPPNLRAIG